MHINDKEDCKERILKLNDGYMNEDRKGSFLEPPAKFTASFICFESL